MVASGKDFRLKDYGPADTHRLHSEDKPEVKKQLVESVCKLSDLQDVLYAEANCVADLSGDGRRRKRRHDQARDVRRESAGSQRALVQIAVRGGIGPRLHGANRCLPARGKIGIFNRSYYEEVLVVRVHPKYLEKQRIPDVLRSDHFWRHRYEDISAFERYLTRNRIAIRKFFLHVSQKEQKKRFMARLDVEEKGAREQLERE